MDKRRSTRCLPLFSSSDPDFPGSETTEDNYPVETTSDDNNPPATPLEIPSLEIGSIPLSIQIALGIVAAIVAFFAASYAITNAQEVATAFVANIQENFWEIIGDIPEALGSLFTTIVEFFKVFLPAVGKFGMEAYQTASPIVSETSQKVIEAATPVIQDTASKVAEVASPT